ncbi:MAG TPA: phosphodiesterase, partial [Clostridiales bacterium]|nr:phosphodiesterase [Clostridiales bacterium]
MKQVYFIASDIHGSAYWCRKMLEAYEKSGAKKLLLLGDILYHGPRNDLPKEYAPKEVIAVLNPLKDRIYAVRGNCEAEVDQMVLDFPVMADYAVLDWNGHTIYATHGHIYNEEQL